MNILIRLLGRDDPKPQRRPAGHADDEGPFEAAGDGNGDDDRPLGCGWFDSSHELRRGLWVHEHTDPDEIAAALPLAWWLVLHGSHAPPAPPAASAAGVDALTMRPVPAAGIIASCH